MAQIINLKELKIYEKIENNKDIFIDWLYENEYIRNNDFTDDLIDCNGVVVSFKELAEYHGEAFIKENKW